MLQIIYTEANSPAVSTFSTGKYKQISARTSRKVGRPEGGGVDIINEKEREGGKKIINKKKMAMMNRCEPTCVREWGRVE
jgi:hypothetical protein